MTDLRPCSGCRRHVALDERVCPFCEAPLAAVSPKDPLLGRMSRAAVFAGAALASTACGGKKAKTENVNNVEQQQSMKQDAGTTVPEPPDTGKEPERGPVPMPYGAPPARRRVV